jgi:hypothetical protein
MCPFWGVFGLNSWLFFGLLLALTNARFLGGLGGHRGQYAICISRHLNSSARLSTLDMFILHY